MLKLFQDRGEKFSDWQDGGADVAFESDYESDSREQTMKKCRY